MKDYQNSNKSKQDVSKEKPTNEKVVVGDVVVQKKTLGKKFRETFIEVDLHSVLRYITVDVLIPAAKNMFVEASTKGVERLIYGDTASVRRTNVLGAQKVSYNRPVTRGYRHDTRMVRSQIPTNPFRSDLILADRDEAELVLERMNDIIDAYDVASVADLNELVGLQTSPLDNKWGWLYLGEARIRQTREGFLLDLPSAEPI